MFSPGTAPAPVRRRDEAPPGRSSNPHAENRASSHVPLLDNVRLNELRVKKMVLKTIRHEEGNIKEARVLSGLELSRSASRTACELCRSNPASLRYELFSTKGLITGGLCLGCLPDLIKTAHRSR